MDILLEHLIYQNDNTKIFWCTKDKSIELTDLIMTLLPDYSFLGMTQMKNDIYIFVGK